MYDKLIIFIILLKKDRHYGQLDAQQRLEFGTSDHDHGLR